MIIDQFTYLSLSFLSIVGLMFLLLFTFYSIRRKLQFGNHADYLRSKIEYYQEKLKLELETPQNRKAERKAIRNERRTCYHCGYYLNFWQSLSVGFYGISFTCPVCKQDNINSKIRDKEGPLY